MMNANLSDKLTMGKSALIKLTALSLALVLASCGGGGSGSSIDVVAPPVDPTVSGGTGGTGTGGTGGTGTGGQTSTLKISSINLYDAEGNITDVVDVNGAQARVVVVDASGKALSKALVSFAIDGAGISLTQTTSGSVLTDENGMAQVYLKPDNVNVTGAYTLTATAKIGEGSDTGYTTFSAQATNLKLSAMKFDKTSLDSGGQTGFEVMVKDDQGAAVPNILLNFVASCGQLTESQSTDVTGVVRGTYKSINSDNTLCSDRVSITATSASGLSKTGSVTVATPAPTSIVYTTTDDIVLGKKGSGSSSTNAIEFTVYSNSTPLPNTEVLVEKDNAPKDFSFGVDGNIKPITLKTDDKGVLKVNLYPGGTAGAVEIRATLVADKDKTALAKNITVATSRVTQQGLSLSMSQNVISADVDGNPLTMTARMVGTDGNPVPDGTVVYFSTEGGMIQPSQPSKGGVSTVTFTTQKPRPIDGRVSVLAIVEGEKQYTDQNKNNAWDAGEPFVGNIGNTNIGNTYRDDNENFQYDAGEYIYESPKEGDKNCAIDTATTASGITYGRDGIYPNIQGTCSSELDAVLRDQAIILFSSDTPIFELLKFTRGYIEVRLNSAKYTYNPMPAGTAVEVSTKDNTKDNKLSCSAEAVLGESPLPNIQPSSPRVDKDGNYVNLGSIHGFALSECAAGDLIKISVTSGGRTSTAAYTVR